MGRKRPGGDDRQQVRILSGLGGEASEGNLTSKIDDNDIATDCC